MVFSKGFRLGLAATAFLAAPAVAVAQSAADAARPVSLAEAVHMAQMNSPITVSARNALRVGKLTEMNAFGQYLPSLRVGTAVSNSAGASFFQGQFVPYQGNPWNYGKMIQRELVAVRRRPALVQLPRGAGPQDANAENDVLQRYVVATQVKQQYYSVLQARELEAAGASALEAAQVGLNAASTKVKSRPGRAD